MIKYIVLSVLVLGLSSCSGRHSGGNYAWIGCHVVTNNPHCYPGNDKCVIAFGPEGEKKIGDRIYFKQLKLGEDRYGDYGPIVTARPCKEGE
jgi:hypothetical protein